MTPVDEVDRRLERPKQQNLSPMPHMDKLRRRPVHLVCADEDKDSHEEGEEIILRNDTEKEEQLSEPKPESSCLSIFGMACTLCVVVACTLCVVVACGTAYFYQNGQYAHIKSNVIDSVLQAQYQVGIAPYKKQFPSQSPELWNELFSGIIFTSKSNRLSVFLILHDDKTNTSCLAQALGRVSAMLLDNSTQPLIVPASNLLGSDTFRRDLIDRRAVVVEELQQMPVGENQMLLLHGLADAENPIAPGIAVVFTLRVQEDSAKSALKAAELELARAWNWIDSESRQPLIVRVTGGFVYKMANEIEVTSC